jgi:DNA polymerase-3 subunit delta'
MIGQEAILKRLDKNGPFVIIGAKGSGKTSLAKEIVLRSICEHGTGCGECKSCKSFLHGNYPDFYSISGGKVDDVRELIVKISVKPFYERHYVLFDDMDTMTTAAQNALLKTIEEPISPTMFIMTGTVQNSILKTILSRCIRLSPQLLDKRTILEELKKRYPEEEEDYLLTVSDYACGSLGCALDMIERKDFYQTLRDDIQNIKKRNFFEMANRYAEKEYKEETLIILGFFEKYLRDVMLEYAKVNRDMTPVYEIIQNIEKYRLELNNNINRNMMYQNLILQIQKVV